MKNKQILAVDFGASSGRGMLCSYDGAKISLREIHRFSNDPVMMPGGFFWTRRDFCMRLKLPF